jgi:hypothetical protein
MKELLDFIFDCVQYSFMEDESILLLANFL